MDGRGADARADNTRTRMRVPTQPDSHTLPHGGMDLLPSAVETPGSEVVVDGPPWWEVSRQKPPWAAAPQDVEDRVEYGTWTVDPGPTTHPLSGQVGLQAVPFGAGQIGRVSRHGPESTLQLSCPDYFSDSLSRQFVE
jgi:hypothetical protein